MMVKDHVFKEKMTADVLKCVEWCNTDVRCQSINYVVSQYICELNDRTREARPLDFISNVDRLYPKRLRERAPLGSVPELPAVSCAEIKASEGDTVVSGNYWMDLIKPGEAVLVPCNMSTGDADECNATVPVCDVNAICRNTVGSFVCICKTGFTGNGFSCTDIDECASGSHSCVSGRATCSNTVGSYNCTCNPGYHGDGKRNCTLDGCQNYQTLTSADRKVTHGSSPLFCDNSLGPAWFRFQGNAGTKLPTSCVSSYRCGTDATGWLNGPHPTVEDGKVTRQVCFSWSGCCTWSINIQVVNCSGYFVYFIDGTPPEHPCHLRYCSTD